LCGISLSLFNVSKTFDPGFTVNRILSYFNPLIAFIETEIEALLLFSLHCIVMIQRIISIRESFCILLL